MYSQNYGFTDERIEFQANELFSEIKIHPGLITNSNDHVNIITGNLCFEDFFH